MRSKGSSATRLEGGTHDGQELRRCFWLEERDGDDVGEKEEVEDDQGGRMGKDGGRSGHGCCCEE